MCLAKSKPSLEAAIESLDLTLFQLLYPRERKNQSNFTAETTMLLRDLDKQAIKNTRLAPTMPRAYRKLHHEGCQKCCGVPGWFLCTHFLSKPKHYLQRPFTPGCHCSCRLVKSTARILYPFISSPNISRTCQEIRIPYIPISMVFLRINHIFVEPAALRRTRGHVTVRPGGHCKDFGVRNNIESECLWDLLD